MLEANTVSDIGNYTEIFDYIPEDEVLNTLILSPIMKFFYTFLPSFGIPGNVFAIGVMLSSSQMRTKPINIFMIHQSIIDLLACVITIITEYTDNINLSNEFDPMETLFCRVVLSAVLMWIVIHASGYNLMFLTLERYWAIKQPLQYDILKVKSRLPCIFFTTWLLGILRVYMSFRTSNLKFKIGLLLTSSEL